MKSLKQYIPFRRQFKNWFVRTWQWKRIVRKHLSKYYSREAPATDCKDRMVICMADGRRLHGGLADRLRSYVSYYSFCKARGLRFAINFTSPFRLEDYLEPNEYDWTLKPGEITYNSIQARPLFFKASGAMTHAEKRYQTRTACKYLNGRRHKQYHLYSNFSFGDEDFGKYFNELFRPVPRIAAIIDDCSKELGEGYISISTRFLELLGDFKEPKHKRSLGEAEQKKLMEKCRAEVEKLHEEWPGVRILLTSDSQKFLDFCTDLPYVYMPAGTIEHIDVKGESEDYTKTFVDFLLISGAAKVYQIKCGPMYDGNFSLRAAQAGGKEHKLIVC